jgi:glutamine amidotransferase PdxT
LLATFHPELTSDTALHEHFLQLARTRPAAAPAGRR